MKTLEEELGPMRANLWGEPIKQIVFCDDLIKG